MTKTLLRTLPVGLAILTATALPASAASYGQNGATGVIDMPTAEMLPDGETAWSFTSTGTAFRSSLTFQLLPRLETSVHYTTINQWIGGVPLFDSSLDLKYRLFAENGAMPSLAIGFRDFLSNGAFSSEYLVASKKFGHGLTVSGGLGWGRLGSNNPLAAPFGARAPSTSTGIDFDQFFKGDMAAFGGVAWATPIKGLTLKAEYSSDAYTGEQAYSGFSPTSPFNFGLDYTPIKGVSLGAYYDYGTDFGLRLTFSGNPNRPIVSPDLGMGPVPVNPRPAGYSTDGSWTHSKIARDAIAGALVPVFAAEGIIIEEVNISDSAIDVYVQNTKMPLTTKVIGRIVRTFSVAMPSSIEIFRVTPVSGGFATTTVEVRRSDVEAQAERPNAGPESWQTTKFSDAANSLGAAAWKRDVYPDFSWSLSPQVPISFATGGEAASLDLLLNASAVYQVSRAFSLNASVSQKLVSSSGAIGGPTMDRLSADYTLKLSPATYARVSAGYLEPKYAGFDGEVVWKPTAQNWGLGLELSAVQERSGDFFGLGTTRTTSGLASVYWDTGYHGIEAQIDAGRYLAGDTGATLTLSRRFANGWEVAGFVTLTDMPFATYGEGNFTKGISVTIPMRWSLPFETRSTTGISLGNSGGAGGATLDIANRIYPAIRDYDMLDFNETWGAYWQ